jgi:VWFA-related protein
MKHLMRSPVATAAIVLFLGIPAGSQVTLRSVTRLVQITVIAQDAQGRPINDLTRDDFLLFDSGHRRDIKVFTVDRGDRQPSPVVAAPPPDAAEHVFTNNSPERSGATGVTVILLDSLNTQWTDQARAIRNVVRFLAEVHPDDHIAVYSIGQTGFRVLHDFTTDASDLVARLASWNGEIPPANARDMGDQLANLLNGTATGPPLDQTTANQTTVRGTKVNPNQVNSTLGVMEMLADRLAGVPGRKNVIWISNGFPIVEWGNLAQAAISSKKPILYHSIDPRNNSNTVTDTIGDSMQFSNPVDRAMRVLIGANVAIYPIETRGLKSYMPDATGRRAPDRTQLGTPLDTVDDQDDRQAMQKIAQRTGGRAFVLNNDLLGAMHTAADDSRVTYTLGFYPESALQNGKFHAVAIKLATRRGVTLRYRQGYLDAPEAPGDPQQRKHDLEQAALSPLDANAIPLAARLSPTSGGSYLVNLNISLSGLNIQVDGDVWSGEVDVFLVQRDQRGQEFGRVNDTITMRLKQATYDRMLKTGAPYRHEITLNPKAEVLRVAVRDARSGDLGSLTIPTKALPK